MIALLAAVLVASLLGSLHCVGMCGGFVAFYAGQDAQPRTLRLLAHVAYNGGRLVTYAALGAAAGALGAAIDLAASAVSLQRGAAILAGVVMLLWGAATLLGALGVKLPLRATQSAARSGLGRVMGRAVRRVARQPIGLRALVIGALTTLLPCGWLYAFVVIAAGTGSATAGAAVMAAFWLGTVPALLTLGIGVRHLARSLGRLVPVLTALALIVLGTVALAGRLRVPAMPRAVVPADRAAALRTVEKLRGEPHEPACCRRKR